MEGGQEILICGFCRFPWCKYFQHGQYQATNIKVSACKISEYLPMGSHELAQFQDSTESMGSAIIILTSLPPAQLRQGFAQAGQRKKKKEMGRPEKSFLAQLGRRNLEQLYEIFLMLNWALQAFPKKQKKIVIHNSISTGVYQ